MSGSADVFHIFVPTMNNEHWDFEHRGRLSYEDTRKCHIQVRSGFVNEGNKHFHVNDVENRYTEIKRFDWIRGLMLHHKTLCKHLIING